MQVKIMPILALLAVLVLVLQVVCALNSSTPEVECVDFAHVDSPFKYRYCHQNKIEQFIGGRGNTPVLIGTYDAKSSSPNEHVFTEGLVCSESKNGKPRQALVSLSTSKHCCQDSILALNSSAPPGIRILNVQETVLCQYKFDVCLPSSPQCKHQTREEQDTRYKMPIREREQILDQVRAIFYHAYNAYLDHAFPADELQPLTCRGVESDLTPGKMLTLIDSMDTLVIMGNISEFHRAIELVSRHEHTMFKVDKTISVFETTIRILGGLLSAHLLCEDKELNIRPANYNGSLLRMARDIGDRLMPAFNSPTNIPYGTVDLLRGVPMGETSEACTAAAGSLSLEFGLLSTLTGDVKYAQASRRALQSLHKFRSPGLNLFGRHIDINNGAWTEPVAGIGSNIDSVYEYYLKQYVLFGDEESYEWFQDLYEGVIRNLRSPGNRFYHEADMRTGKVTRRYASALQAFWPGMQVLAGDLIGATKTLNAFMSISNEFTFLPEDFDLVRWAPLAAGNSPSYLLRPELIESIFYVYRATGDDSWLLAGKQLLNAVIQHCYVPKCGFASIRDVTAPIKKQQVDSMPSFFLSEWAKYVYLLFADEGNAFNKGNWVFTTEAHPLRVTSATQSTFPLRHKRQQRQSAKLEDVPSLDLDDECSADLNEVESYYMAQPDTAVSFRPFVAGADLVEQIPATQTTSQAQEQKHVGVLEGVGPFEILSTYNSFQVTRMDNTGDKVVLSNIDSSTAMVTFGNEHHPRFLHLKSDAAQLEYGKACLVSIIDSKACPSRFWESQAMLATLPCSVSEGYGDPRWFDFVQPEPQLQVLSFPSLCNADELRLHQHARPAKFWAHAPRGTCSFEEKALMAKKLGAFGLLVTLLHPTDEFFVMAPSSSTTAHGSAAAVPTFLVHSHWQLRHGAHVHVALHEDTRVSCSHKKVRVTGFRDWRASFGVEKEGGMFRIHLQKS